MDIVQWINKLTVLMDTVVCKFKLKCNSIIFLLKKFQNVIKAHVTCLHTHFIPPHPKILYETLICVQKKFVIERIRDLIYLKFVATDFFLKIISHSAGENSGDLA